MWKKFFVNKTNDFSTEEARMKRKNYDLQNYLLESYHFPEAYFMDEKGEGDILFSLWSDRLDKKLPWKSLHGKKLLEETKQLIKNPNISGVRLVEFTNLATGYPVYRIDIFIKHPKTPDSDITDDIQGDIDYF